MRHSSIGFAEATHQGEREFIDLTYFETTSCIGSSYPLSSWLGNSVQCFWSKSCEIPIVSDERAILYRLMASTLESTKQFNQDSCVVPVLKDCRWALWFPVDIQRNIGTSTQHNRRNQQVSFKTESSSISMCIIVLYIDIYSDVAQCMQYIYLHTFVTYQFQTTCLKEHNSKSNFRDLNTSHRTIMWSGNS